MVGTIPTAWQHGAHGHVRLAFFFQVTNWFTKSLNYQYDPLMHGNVAEWLSDLISISFTEPPKYFKRSMRSIKVRQHTGCTDLLFAFRGSSRLSPAQRWAGHHTAAQVHWILCL